MRKIATKKSIRENYNVGMRIKVKKTQTKVNDIPSITGRITGVYDDFIVVDNGRIRESFMYVDMITGDVSAKEVGA